ncbi:hypothetical protein CIPAW_14G090900 [Carya illinoinensis]|uniref:Uncharacterized protein n=1 Tax=Carya illinoinensis TaxID=32201 RepID=A0A8T1NGM7_CARIL|nr:hypothetical protein CIPAW_14G090900 [Carya illinoinensis]
MMRFTATITALGACNTESRWIGILATTCLNNSNRAPEDKNRFCQPSNFRRMQFNKTE